MRYIDSFEVEVVRQESRCLVGCKEEDHPGVLKVDFDTEAVSFTPDDPNSPAKILSARYSGDVVVLLNVQII